MTQAGKNNTLSLIFLMVSVASLTALWAFIIELTVYNSPGIGPGPYSDPSERVSSSAAPLSDTLRR